MPGYWRSRIPFVIGLEKLDNFALIPSSLASGWNRIGLPCLQEDLYVAPLNLLVRHTEVSRLGRCDRSGQLRPWSLRTVRPWLRTAAVRSRQASSVWLRCSLPRPAVGRIHRCASFVWVADATSAS
jgi:hypothetical protein